MVSVTGAGRARVRHPTDAPAVGPDAPAACRARCPCRLRRPSRTNGSPELAASARRHAARAHRRRAHLDGRARGARGLQRLAGLDDSAPLSAPAAGASGRARRSAVSVSFVQAAASGSTIESARYASARCTSADLSSSTCRRILIRRAALSRPLPAPRQRPARERVPRTRLAARSIGSSPALHPAADRVMIQGGRGSNNWRNEARAGMSPSCSRYSGRRSHASEHSHARRARDRRRLGHGRNTVRDGIVRARHRRTRSLRARVGELAWFRRSRDPSCVHDRAESVRMASARSQRRARPPPSRRRDRARAARGNARKHAIDDPLYLEHEGLIPARALVAPVLDPRPPWIMTAISAGWSAGR